MKHKAIFYLADRKINEMMKAADLCPNGKIFCKLLEVSFSTTRKVDKNYFMKIINESKKKQRYWIAAISYMDNRFIDKNVKIISDGITECHLFSEITKYNKKNAKRTSY